MRRAFLKKGEAHTEPGRKISKFQGWADESVSAVEYRGEDLEQMSNRCQVPAGAWSGRPSARAASPRLSSSFSFDAGTAGREMGMFLNFLSNNSWLLLAAARREREPAYPPTRCMYSVYPHTHIHTVCTYVCVYTFTGFYLPRVRGVGSFSHK